MPVWRFTSALTFFPIIPAFAWGWTSAQERSLRKTMIVWTVSWLVSAAAAFLGWVLELQG